MTPAKSGPNPREIVILEEYIDCACMKFSAEKKITIFHDGIITTGSGAANRANDSFGSVTQST